jgi:hypothetical protein
MRNIFIIPLSILFMAAAAISAEMKDYAYGINIDGELEVDGVYKFPIPLRVYERAADSELSDIALFNSAGEKIPFTTVRPKPSYYTAPDNESVTFYKETYEHDNKTLIKHLIADINGFSGNIKDIRFIFNKTPDFSGRISISYSTGDLGNFSTAAYDITLAKLGGIIQDTAETRVPEKAKYLRLTGDQSALSAIGGAAISFKPEPVYERIEKIILDGVLDKEKNILDFKLTGVYPVEFISLKTPEAYLYKEVELNTAERDNSTRGSYVSYKDYPIIKGISGYSTGNTRTRRIRIIFDEPLSEAVAANFYWRSDEIIFIAKGSAPFTLAYGNISEKGKPVASYDELAKRSSEAETLELSDNEFVLSGESALTLPPEETHTLRRAILFGSMFLVVLVISAITVRLLIKSKDSGTERDE